MPETLRQAAAAGIKVIRVWAFGEGGPKTDVKHGRLRRLATAHTPFRLSGNWNERAFDTSTK